MNIANERRNVASTRSVPLDELDWAILAELQADGRLSYNELSRRVHLSGPAVAERVKRLELAQVITGYTAKVDAQAAGQPLLVFIRLRCRPGSCLLRTSTPAAFPEIVEIHKLPGTHCAVAKARASSLAHLEGFLEQLGTHGQLETDIVLSTQYTDRPIQVPSPDRTVTASRGWAPEPSPSPDS